MTTTTLINCPQCGCAMEKVMATQRDSLGRVRQICDYLECPRCGQKESVDDTFDTPWAYPNKKADENRQ